MRGAAVAAVWLEVVLDMVEVMVLIGFRGGESAVRWRS